MNTAYTCGPRKKRTPAVCITADAMRGGGGTIDRNHTLRASQDMLDFEGASNRWTSADFAHLHERAEKLDAQGDPW